MSTTSGIQAGVTTGSSLSGGSGSLPNDPIGTLDEYGDEIFGGYSTRRLKGIFPKLLPADYSGARAAYSLRKVRSGYPDKTLPAEYGGGAAVAYSLRRVNAAYNGPAIKVRRSSDDAVQDIGFSDIGGLDTTALTTFVNEDVNLFTSNYSSGGVAEPSHTTFTETIDETKEGKTECLKAVWDGTSPAQIFKLNFLPTEQGVTFDISAEFYLEGFTSVRMGANGNFGDLNSTTNEWATYTQTITVNNTNDDFVVSLNGGTSGSTIWLKNIVITQTTADGAVTTFYDQSGNGNNATNATSSQQPLIVEAGSVVTENGKPAIKFDGTADALEFTELNLGDNSWFINAVYNSTRTTLEDYFLYGALGQTRIRIYETTARFYINNVSYSTSIISHRNTQQLFTFKANASKILSVYQNGTKRPTEHTIGTGYSFLPSSLGQAGGSRTIDGLVQEVIIFNSDQSDNRPFIEENINVYYDIYAQDEWDKESAIKVRRSSDDAVQDIGFVGNELDTTSLTNFVGAANLLTYSNQFDTNWQTTEYIVTDGQEGYDGSEDAWLIDKQDTANTYLRQNNIPNIDASGYYTTSVYAKKGTLNVLMIYVNGYIRIDLRDGSLQSSGGIFDSYNVDSVGNGWYKISITIASNMPNRVYFKPVADNGTDTSGSVYIQDAQLNPGATATTYVETTTGQSGFGYVTTWYDQSGFGNHASNSTATQQPLIVDAGNAVTKNGKSAIDFDGVNDDLTFTDTGTMANGCSSFTVFAADDAAQDSVAFYKVVDADNTLSVGLRLNVVGARLRLGGAESSKGGTSSTDQVLLSQTSVTSPFMTAHLDGVEVTTSAAIRLSGVGSSIGSRVGSDYHFDGTMQEIVFFESNQSTNRRDIEWNINNHYSIYEQWNRNSALSVRRSSDDTTKQIGFDGSSDMSESEVLSFVNDASPVLDDNSGAVSAYSLRKVLTTYTGSAIKVRRSSDDALQDIGFDSNGDLDITTLLAFVGNNLCSNPNEWANGATRNGWTEIGGTVCTFVENVADADGGTNATRITRTATGSGTFRNTFEGYLQEGEQYTFSVYLRSTNSAQVRLDVSDQIGPTITLNSTWTLYTYTITQDSSPQNFSDFSISSPTDGVVEVYNPMVNHGATALPFEDNASAGAGFGYVTTWYDQTGNSDATQTTDSEQPLVVSAGAVVTEGDRPAMSLVDGQYFDNAGVDGYSRFDFFSVSKITDTTGMFLTFSTGGGKYSWVYTQGSANTTFYSSFGTPTMYSNSVLQSISDRGDVYNAYNGHKIITTLGGDTSGWTDGKFFAYSSPFGVSGTVQEIISFDSDQSSSRLGIEGNIGRYYNITGYRNGFVSKWYDQSNNDNHLENATASQQPKIVENGVMITENGKPAIEFNRTTEEDILSAAASFSQPVTHFFVRRITDLTNGTQVPLSYQAGVGTPWGEIYYQNLFRTHFSGGYLGTFEGVEDLLLQYVFANGTDSTIAYNGAEGDTGNVGTNNVSGLHVGRNSSSGTYESNVKAQELIIYQRDASAIRREIEEIINRHFRIYL